jgi:two-component system KDP operon response regulator KdpE
MDRRTENKGRQEGSQVQRTRLRGKRILVVDDDPQMLELLQDLFGRAGARVYAAAGGVQGLRQFSQHQPDLIILDIMMPDLDGWEVCSRIRRLSDVPVIFLTALDESQDAVRGFRHGAVDYVTKPFSTQVLLARAEAALRRETGEQRPHRAALYDDGYLTIDLENRLVLVRGEQAQLTVTEYGVLAFLYRQAGRTFTSQQILEYLRGWEEQGDINYVHVYIHRLRRKLEPDPGEPRYLLTERGLGYCFEKQPLDRGD